MSIHSINVRIAPAIPYEPSYPPASPPPYRNPSLPCSPSFYQWGWLSGISFRFLQAFVAVQYCRIEFPLWWVPAPPDLIFLMTVFEFGVV